MPITVQLIRDPPCDQHQHRVESSVPKYSAQRSLLPLHLTVTPPIEPAPGLAHHTLQVQTVRLDFEQGGRDFPDRRPAGGRWGGVARSGVLHDPNRRVGEPKLGAARLQFGSGQWNPAGGIEDSDDERLASRALSRVVCQRRFRQAGGERLSVPLQRRLAAERHDPARPVPAHVRLRQQRPEFLLGAAPRAGRIFGQAVGPRCGCDVGAGAES